MASKDNHKHRRVDEPPTQTENYPRILVTARLVQG